MASDLFAMEALASTVWRMADQHTYDVRIEAAIAKIFCSERTILFLKDTQIIFGGMGYETAESKRFRRITSYNVCYTKLLRLRPHCAQNSPSSEYGLTSCRGSHLGFPL